MAVLNEAARGSDVVLYEAGEEVNFTRSSVTLISGTVASVTGQVLGQATIGAATSAAKSGGNTGNGTCVVDATTPVIANGQVGTYSVRCTVAGTNSATFRLSDPNGRILQDIAYSGAGATASFLDQLKFVITDGSTDFIVGDGFDITVAAGSGKWAQVAPAAFDGTQYAAGILLTPNTATLTADTSVAALVRGPAILKNSGIAYTSGMTTPQKTTALAQLAALGIQVRTDYGA